MIVEKHSLCSILLNFSFAALLSVEGNLIQNQNVEANVRLSTSVLIDDSTRGRSLCNV